MANYSARQLIEQAMQPKGRERLPVVAGSLTNACAREISDWTERLILDYEAMAGDIWSKYDVAAVEKKIGRKALEKLTSYDLDTVADGADSAIAAQIVALALKHNRL